MMLTGSQYRRLCLVLVLPLLLLGYVVATYAMPYNRLQVIMCEQSFVGRQNCRDVGDWNGPFYEHVKNNQKAWFDIRMADYEPERAIVTMTQGSLRLLEDVEIVKSEPYLAQGPQVRQLIDGLAGMQGSIQLGIADKEQSILMRDTFFLTCNSLGFHPPPGLYHSMCYGDGWSGPILYRVTSQTQDELQELEAEIQKLMQWRVTEYRIYQAVTYPMFIYLFLILSALVWVTRKAVAFVKRG